MDTPIGSVGQHVHVDGTQASVGGIGGYGRGLWPFGGAGCGFGYGGGDAFVAAFFLESNAAARAERNIIDRGQQTREILFANHQTQLEVVRGQGAMALQISELRGAVAAGLGDNRAAFSAIGGQLAAQSAQGFNSMQQRLDQLECALRRSIDSCPCGTVTATVAAPAPVAPPAGPAAAARG